MYQAPLYEPAVVDVETTPARSPAPKHRRRWRWFLLKWSFVVAVWSTLALAGTILWFAWDLPRPERALDAARRPTLTLQDHNGHAFATFGDVVGESLHLADLPAYLPQAVIAVEDRRFSQHHGIDLIGILRAAIVNLRAGHVVQGGSTLTQQVAKNLFLSNARTTRRKVQELLLTLWLEHTFSKRDILEIWLNRVYLGAGAYGVDAAAHVYFGVSARHLTLAQAAVLAGLPRAPSRFSPRSDPQAAIARARQVLAAMVETGVITADAAAAAGTSISFAAPPAATAGYFADWAADQAERALASGTDATVRTTLDARLQAAVESHLAALLDGPGAAAGVGQGAVVVLDAAHRAVRAMAGGRAYRASAYNRATTARRQPGSAFKPFVWLAALEAGVRPDDSIMDAPLSLGGWSPANFDGKFRGAVTVETGLAESLNTVAVRLLLKAGGPGPVAAVAHRLGIASPLRDDATLALGTSEVGVLELAAAYAPFFNGGLRVTPAAIEAITADGHTEPTAAEPGTRVIRPEDAAMMLRMMTAVVARGSGHAAALPGHSVAGKTGTTQDSRDAWFVGGVDGLVIAVWLGNDDATAMRNVTGGSLPAALFHQIAADAVAGR